MKISYEDVHLPADFDGPYRYPMTGKYLGQFMEINHWTYEGGNQQLAFDRATEALTKSLIESFPKDHEILEILMVRLYVGTDRCGAGIVQVSP